MSDIVKAAEREIARLEILKICEEAAPEGASTLVLRACLHKVGVDMSDEELQRQISYLDGKSLVQVENVENRGLGIRRCIVRITAAGMDFLEGNREESGIGG